MAHLHSDMERLDVHVALEACDIVIESATIVAILEIRFKDGKAYYLTIRSRDKSSAAPRSGRTTNELPGTSVSPGSTFCSR